MEITLYDKLKFEYRAKLDVLNKDIPETIQSIIKELKSHTNALELKWGLVIEIQTYLQPGSISANEIYKLFND